MLPAAGIFGANASGKSNVLRALVDMRRLVLTSFRSGTDETPIYRRPFLLDSAVGVDPSRFEVNVVINGVRWQYGFEVTDNRVVAEYAFRFPKGRQALVFDREEMRFRFGATLYTQGRLLEQLVRPNSLLLSVGGAATNQELAPLYRWFATNLLYAESLNRPIRAARTAELFRGPKRDRVLALLRAADLGVVEMASQQYDAETLDRMRRAARILTGQEGEPDGSEPDAFVIEDFVNLVHVGTNGPIELDARDESLGTLVWLGLIGPVIDALDGGRIFIADELDASLHPLLCEQLVRLFQDPLTNPFGAQLVFNAHDPTLLGDSAQRSLGRDQIWLTEKDNRGASRLYAASDFGPRADEALSRRYLQGRYGAVPVLDIGEFERAAVLADA